MRIVGVTACIAGIAHTYIAKEKLVQAAKILGHDVKVETQGTIGVQDQLTQSDIDKADIVIISADIKISGEDRFIGKPITNVPLGLLIKSPVEILKKVGDALERENQHEST